MIYKQLTLIFSILIVSFNLSAQKTTAEKAFIKSLIEDEYSDPSDARKLNLKEIPNSVSLGEEGDPYTVSYSIIAHEDLNNDGIDDYIVLRNSEGMMGGNVNTNQEYQYFIMKNDSEVDKRYGILGYAPFSYNIVDDISYKNKRLTAHITQNFRTYMAEDLQSTTAHFVYKNNNLYEESYLTDCAMAQMKDKSIFKSDLPNITRNLNMDMDNYTEFVGEEYIQGDTIIRATLEGCDNLTLAFDISIKFPKEKFTLQFNKGIALEAFDVLIARTRYKTILNKILVDYKKRPSPYNDKGYTKLDENWSYTVSNSSYDGNRLGFWITLKNTVNPNQDENWDITTRRK